MRATPSTFEGRRRYTASLANQRQYRYPAALEGGDYLSSRIKSKGSGLLVYTILGGPKSRIKSRIVHLLENMRDRMGSCNHGTVVPDDSMSVVNHGKEVSLQATHFYAQILRGLERGEFSIDPKAVQPASASL